MTELALLVPGRVRPVGALLLVPPKPRFMLALAHGAGAGMRHPFLEALARGLAEQGAATLRYQFPYMEDGSRRTDPPAVATATVRAAVDLARAQAGGMPLFAGGKSFGGRMTTTAAADAPLDGVRGIALFGFPLHPVGRPGVARAAHLARVTVPMLFLQGSRDTLADPALMEGVSRDLGSRAHLHLVDGADHSFHVLKRSGRTDADVLEELATQFAAWASGIAS